MLLDHLKMKLKTKSFKKVDVIHFDQTQNKFKKLASFPHSYPPTKIMWLPDIVI